MEYKRVEDVLVQKMSKNIEVDKQELVVGLRHEGLEDLQGSNENEHSMLSVSMCSLETPFCEDSSLMDFACNEKVTDLEMTTQSLAAPKDSQSKGNQLINLKLQSLSKSIITQYPGNCSFVQTIRPFDDDGFGPFGYESGHDSGSSTSFEFHKGNRAFHRSVLGSFSKSVPSKWDDAEKWLVSHSCANDHAKKKSKPPAAGLFQAISTHSSRKGFAANQLGHRMSTTKSVSSNASVVLTDYRTVEEGLCQDEGETKKIDSEFDFMHTTSFTKSVNSKDFLHCHPSEDAFSRNLHNQKEVKDDEAFFRTSLQNLKPIVDPSIVSSKHVSMRDMGTEMTPIASQDPSRTGTPIRATTPMIQSPLTSQPSTPGRGASETLLMEMAESELGQREKGRAVFMDIDFQTKNGKEIMLPGTQLGKDDVVDWASKEEEESDASKSLKNIDLEQAKRYIWQSRATAWQEAEEAKYTARYKEEAAKIQAWENHQKAKAESEMMRVEVKVERMKSHAHEKLLYKLAALKQHAEQKRATAKARQDGQAAKITERADYIRRTGRMPIPFFCCTFCF